MNSETVNPTMDSVDPSQLVIEDVKAPISAEQIHGTHPTFNNPILDDYIKGAIVTPKLQIGQFILDPMNRTIIDGGKKSIDISEGPLLTPGDQERMSAEILKQLQPDTMLRYNNGKSPQRLIPPSLDRYLAAVLDYGAKKYAENNWRKGGSWLSAYDSLKRHQDAWLDGEEFDKESGLPHLAHMAFGIMVLIEFYDTDRGTDDRFRYDDPVTRKELHYNEPPKLGG